MHNSRDRRMVNSRLICKWLLSWTRQVISPMSLMTVMLLQTLKSCSWSCFDSNWGFWLFLASHCSSGSGNQPADLQASLIPFPSGPRTSIDTFPRAEKPKENLVIHSIHREGHEALIWDWHCITFTWERKGEEREIGSTDFWMTTMHAGLVDHLVCFTLVF